ncbi:hypothetical protein H8S33_01810 [Ornithinibacillus sp. BX22]|uniref:Uncharacterized protein n=2 Tax=Ornithinibacillus TaxID=484508 RepID=A0A923L349_9BACI|nr:MULTISPECIES: hypothetical protein [Ornithinibacillus]MBC5635551.1 hypothetical protein [Ornithinibacillus hominis]MBS3679161.1 hypothetical protein [Ornithinibacillus massiliensis]
MRERTIYFIFTDTGTYLSRMINLYTNKSLNHVSIGFDHELKEVYSFGRVNPKNPFSGGFVREDIRGEFLKHANSAIYALNVTELEYVQIRHHIKEIEKRSADYKYNFIGLLGIAFKIEIRRKNAFFCSQFVATVMQDTDSFKLSKPTNLVTPSDIRENTELKLLYQGRLGDYPKYQLREEVLDLPKQSLIHLVSKKVKQLVFSR